MRKRSVVLVAGIVVSCRVSVVDVGSPITGSEAGSDASAPVWSGNESNCPVERPETVTPCEVREAQTCGYWFQEQGESMYKACTCWEKDRSIKLWDCFQSTVYPTCPTVQPQESASCTRMGVGCPFPPHTWCDCSVDPDPRWKCGRDSINPPPREVAGPPSTLPPDTMIKDASDADLQTWCGWYSELGPPGHAFPIENPIDADGYARNYGAIRLGSFYAGVCMPMNIPISYCMASMRLDQCEATLAELTDCVLTVQRQSPTPHGCGRFLAAPNCLALFVHRLEASDGGTIEDCGSLRVR
jgi:hypothetical protein